MELYVCRTCDAAKPASAFNWRRWRYKDSSSGRTRHLDCIECKSKATAARRALVKAEVYERLGGKCYCCGETELTFLGIDHKDGGGAAHRRELGDIGGRLFVWLHSRPEEDHRFQLACHNCNMSKHLLGGVCAHQLDSDLVEAR